MKAKMARSMATENLDLAKTGAMKRRVEEEVIILTTTTTREMTMTRCNLTLSIDLLTFFIAVVNAVLFINGVVWT